MQPALLIRLRPAGPWRFGPGDGAPDQVDTLYRSDRLYSALTLAMRSLGALEEWLDATARSASPAVTFSSLFPYQGDVLFAIPPRAFWPPPASQIRAPNSAFLAKIRWKTAHFVPLPLIQTLMTGSSILAEQWTPDSESGCLLRRDRPSSAPFRTITRKTAAVDRLAHVSYVENSNMGIEFEPGAGLWTVCRFSGEQALADWGERVKGAFRLLADEGFGGRRNQGWGHAEPPEFESGAWPDLLFPKLKDTYGKSEDGDGSKFWLLSLFSPASADRIEWSSGDYDLTLRGGKVDSPEGGSGTKRVLRMVTEGSVLVAASEPNGAAIDVAPDGFTHPVYRSGLALALQLPPIVLGAEQVEEVQAVETPSEGELACESPASPALEDRIEDEPAIEEPETAPEAEHVPGSDAPAEESSVEPESLTAEVKVLPEPDAANTPDIQPEEEDPDRAI